MSSHRTRAIRKRGGGIQPAIVMRSGGGRGTRGERAGKSTYLLRGRLFHTNKRHDRHFRRPRSGRQHRKRQGQAVPGLIGRRLQIPTAGKMLAFRWGCAGLQIIGQRDHRQKNQRQHTQGDQLHPDCREQGFRCDASQVGTPSSAQRDGHRYPQKIEESFHDAGSIIPN